ncbi:hypothetical protein D3C87_1103910 [compost metagenome]
MNGIKVLQNRQQIALRGQRRTLESPGLCQRAQVFQPLMIGRETSGPPQTEQAQRRQRGHVQRSLPPTNKAVLALVELNSIGFGKNDPAEQMAYEPRVTHKRSRQYSIVHATVGKRFSWSSGAGQVEAAKCTRALTTMTAEGHFNELAKPFAEQSQLMRIIENTTSTKRVTLLMHAHDHLAIETMQQRFKLHTYRTRISRAQVFAQAHTQHMITFLPGQLIKEFIEA